MRILVAGIGNVFFGDDGFGVAVAQRLAKANLPQDTRVLDTGIRGLHLAYELLEPCDLLVAVDAVSRGGTPGTVYLIEPEIGTAQPVPGGAHGVDLPAVFAMVRTLGGTLPRVLLVGCEASRTDEGLGLTTTVEAAVEEAAKLIEELAWSEHRGEKRWNVG